MSSGAKDLKAHHYPTEFLDKVTKSPIDLKDASKKEGKSYLTRRQAVLRRQGRYDSVSDRSLIGQRGAAEKVGKLGEFKKTYADKVKSDLDFEKLRERAAPKSTWIDRDDYVARTARKIVGREKAEEAALKNYTGQKIQ